MRELINAQLNELKDNTLSFFVQIVKEFENRYKIIKINSTNNIWISDNGNN